MSDTILSGKLTVYYSDENRRKQIRWTGTADKSDTQKMIDVYDATEDLFTQPTQQDDGLIFSAETPGEYTIGKIDAGEIDPWFIDLVSMEHVIGDFQNFTGCAVKTSGWTRVEGSNTGIIVVAVLASGNNIVTGDIGYDITHTDGDDGTLLDVVVTGGSIDYLFIRPDTYNAADSFDNTAGTLTCNGHTAEQDAASVTGEMVWSNPYSKGPLVSDTHVYLFQNGQRVTRIGVSTDDWWEDGHVDRAVPITDWTTDAFPIIDEGYLTVYARQYGSLHSYDIIRMNSTSGGNVSAALSSGSDTNNETGYASITLAGATGNWTVGDEIIGYTTGARAIITQIDNPGATPTLHYYYVGDPMTAFNGSEAVYNADDTGTSSGSGAVANQGPALSTWFAANNAPTISFGNTTEDVDDDASAEPYSIDIDVNQATLAQMYEWAKYVQRRSSTFDLDGLDGQEYIGIDYRVNYTGSVVGTVSEGDSVTGATSGATGVIVSHHTTEKILALRNSRGTFVDGEQIEVNGSNYIPASGTTVTAITPVLANALCLKAGTLVIGATGVLFSDYITTEENNFTLTDINGVSRARPTSVSMTISNLAVADWASCFRLTAQAADIDKEEYIAAGGESIGDATLTVGGSITVDTVGKSAGGRLVLVDISNNNKEYVLRFSSWSGSVFTLANDVITGADAGTDTDTIVEAGFFADKEVGDLVLNTDRGDAISYIKSIDSAGDSCEIEPPITGQTTGDNIEINAVPIAVLSGDYIYAAIILTYIAAGTSTSASLQYLADIYTRVRVRNTADAAEKIKGYTGDFTIGTGGGAAVATRIPNTVYGA